MNKLKIKSVNGHNCINACGVEGSTRVVVEIFDGRTNNGRYVILSVEDALRAAELITSTARKALSEKGAAAETVGDMTLAELVDMTLATAPETLAAVREIKRRRPRSHVSAARIIAGNVHADKVPASRYLVGTEINLRGERTTIEAATAEMSRRFFDALERERNRK